MSGHTPGPWFAVKGQPGIFNGCDVVVSAVSTDAIVCALGHDVPGDQGNGRLIAAAPDYHQRAHSLAMRALRLLADLDPEDTQGQDELRSDIDAVLALHERVERA